MAKTIAMAEGKARLAETATAVDLAAFLGQKRRSLLVDMDPQTAVAECFALDGKRWTLPRGRLSIRSFGTSPSDSVQAMRVPERTQLASAWVALSPTRAGTSATPLFEA